MTKTRITDVIWGLCSREKIENGCEYIECVSWNRETLFRQKEILEKAYPPHFTDDIEIIITEIDVYELMYRDSTENEIVPIKIEKHQIQDFAAKNDLYVCNYFSTDKNHWKQVLVAWPRIQTREEVIMKQNIMTEITRLPIEFDRLYEEGAINL